MATLRQPVNVLTEDESCRDFASRALVALFTGAFLVFSILSLSVAQRLPQLALLGVLGLGARDRLRLVLAESALIGGIGSLRGETQ